MSSWTKGTTRRVTTTAALLALTACAGGMGADDDGLAIDYERYELANGLDVMLVVGDARTQLPRLRALGLGEPTLLDREGLPVM